MKDSRPLECNALAGGYCFWVFSVVGGGIAAVVLNLPDIPQTPDIPRHIPGYTKNPMSFNMGFSVQK